VVGWGNPGWARATLSSFDPTFRTCETPTSSRCRRRGWICHERRIGRDPDCNDFSRMLAFWQQALRYVLREPHPDDWVILRDPDGTHVNVSQQLVPEKRVGKNRLHLDLYTNDQEGEVERLLQLGATGIPGPLSPVRTSWSSRTRGQPLLRDRNERGLSQRGFNAHSAAAARDQGGIHQAASRAATLRPPCST